MNNTSLIFKAKNKAIQDNIQELFQELIKITNECPHLDLTYKYNGSSGNWDKSDDQYWIDWKCHDCSKSWTTSQDYSWDLTTKVYPQARRIF